MKNLISINAECYSGFKADEYSKYFYLDKCKFEIFEITDRWYQGANITDGPVSNYFKVETSCGQQFILKPGKITHSSETCRQLKIMEQLHSDSQERKKSIHKRT